MVLGTRTNVTGTGRHLGYGALLGDTFFRLAVAPDRQLEIVTAPLEAPRVNTGATAEDFTNEFGTRFSRANFSGGEGLVYAQRADAGERDATRYYDSRNIEVDRDGNVTLLHAMEELDTGSRLAYVDGTFYATSGTLLRSTADPNATAPTFGDDDPHAAEGATTVTDVVGVGSTAYAAVGDGIHRKVAGGAWAHWHTRTGITRLWAAKGRVWAAVGNLLYAYDTGATPTETTVLTIPVDAVFHDLTDADSHVLVTASDGYIYAITDDGTTLTVAGQTNLEGEVPHGIGAYFGAVIYGTAVATRDGGQVGRLYSASLNGAVLGNIQRLRTWDATTLDRTPRFVTQVGDSLFTAVAQAADETDMWRYDPSTAALHRSYIVGESSMVAAASVGETLWASGVWRVSDLYPSEGGYIISPLADLFTSQEKSWASIDTTYSGLTGTGESVSVRYSTAATDLDLASSTTWRSLARYTIGDRTGEARLSNVVSRYLSVQLRLVPSGDLALAPVVRAFSVRAFPQSSELIVRMPVSVSDQVERPGKARVSVRGRGREVLDAIVALEGRNTTLELPHLGETLRGIVERVERPVQSIARRGEPSQWAWVTFRGERVTTTPSTDGLVLMGTYSNGFGLMGTSPMMGASA